MVSGSQSFLIFPSFSEFSERMPYLLISTQIRLECGPTICGDEYTDPEIMKQLGAELVQQCGNNFKEYIAPDTPRAILNKLETLGYTVIAATGVGQTHIWTLHKPLYMR